MKLHDVKRKLLNLYKPRMMGLNDILLAIYQFVPDRRFIFLWLFNSMIELSFITVVTVIN